ncbi:unnamed protein product [Brassica oleracea]
MEETTVTVVATKRYALDPYVKVIQSRSNDIDVSFSSYLKPDNNNYEQQKEQEDTELSIFEARSYFSESGGNDNDPRFSSVSSAKVSSFTGLTETGVEAARNDPDGFSDAGHVLVLAPSRFRSKKPNLESRNQEPVLSEPFLTEPLIITTRLYLRTSLHLAVLVSRL